MSKLLGDGRSKLAASVVAVPLCACAGADGDTLTESESAADGLTPSAAEEYSTTSQELHWRGFDAPRRKGHRRHKVEICYVPEGNPDQARTLEVPLRAALRLLRRNPESALGPCTEPDDVCDTLRIEPLDCALTYCAPRQHYTFSVEATVGAELSFEGMSCTVDEDAGPGELFGGEVHRCCSISVSTETVSVGAASPTGECAPHEVLNACLGSDPTPPGPGR